MRRAVFLLAFLACAAAAPADTIYNYGGDYLPEWKLQLVYKEKFFENTVHYREFMVFGAADDRDASYTSANRGMRHDFMFRLGLPDGYVLDAGAQYVYQSLDSQSFNNLQTASLFGEKYFDWWGAMAGFKASFWNGMPFDERLVDAREEMTVMLGLFAWAPAGVFRWNAGLFSETNVLYGKAFQGSLMAEAAAGLNIFSSEYQSIDFMLEAAYSARLYGSYVSYALYLTPQFRVEFFNDFSFIIAVEFYGAAGEIYINEILQPRYLLKINYTANSDKRAVKQKEPEPQPAAEKKWWHIEGVDDEMVPDSWKDESLRKDKPAI
jgi:hypothetical protein